MPREKVKFALRIRPETQQLVKDLCPKANCQNQNEFIEKAIHFYAGYLATEDAADFLPPLYSSALRGIVHDSENRTCRLLFKLAVEIDMMMNVLAGAAIPLWQLGCSAGLRGSLSSPNGRSRKRQRSGHV